MRVIAEIFFLFPLITMVPGYRRVRYSETELAGKIIGGQDAKITDFPFMVKLETTVGDHLFGCGGSYIKELWVLTAAHCLDINDGKDLPPSTGTDHARVKCIMGLDDLDMNVPIQTLRSVRLFIRSDYFCNSTEVVNDIGLIKLPEPFNLSSRVQMIATPTAPMIVGGEKVTLVGWGSVGVNKSATHKLQMLTTTAHDQYDCKRKTRTGHGICIGEDGKMSCSGDSGGPLIYKKVVVGVCSYGFICGEGYSVYENVYAHVNWLDSISGKESYLNYINWNTTVFICISLIISTSLQK